MDESLLISLALTHSLSLSLSLTHTHTRTHTHTHTHSHTARAAELAGDFVSQVFFILIGDLSFPQTKSEKGEEVKSSHSTSASCIHERLVLIKSSIPRILFTSNPMNKSIPC